MLESEGNEKPGACGRHGWWGPRRSSPAFIPCPPPGAALTPEPRGDSRERDRWTKTTAFPHFAAQKMELGGHCRRKDRNSWCPCPNPAPAMYPPWQAGGPPFPEGAGKVLLPTHVMLSHEQTSGPVGCPQAGKSWTPICGPPHRAHPQLARQSFQNRSQRQSLPWGWAVSLTQPRNSDRYGNTRRAVLLAVDRKERGNNFWKSRSFPSAGPTVLPARPSAFQQDGGAEIQVGGLGCGCWTRGQPRPSALSGGVETCHRPSAGPEDPSSPVDAVGTRHPACLQGAMLQVTW